MVPYFPFFDKHDESMGIRPYTPQDRLIEIDDQYLQEIALKRDLLERDHGFYYRALPETRLAQWEVLAQVLEDLACNQPDLFRLDKQGDQWTWENHLLGETTQFRFEDSASLPLEPLDWVGRQVQEDLVLLSEDIEARFVGGQLCFPNGWSLRSKWNQPLLQVHQPAPAIVGPTMQTANRLMNRLRPHRPVWRASWNFKLLDDLEMSDREKERVKADFARRAPDLTTETIGEQLWLRIERQTFLKLSRSQYTLFVIHTYQSLLETEARDPNRARLMLQTIQTTPRVLLDYKSVTPIEEVLVEYLTMKAEG